MPIFFDQNTGSNRVALNSFLTIEEAVLVLLGKSLEEHPSTCYIEEIDDEAVLTLEDYLQEFYDHDEKELAEKGLDYHERLLDAVEDRDLFLYENQIRVVKLIKWAEQNGIYINNESLMGQIHDRASKRVKGQLYESRKVEILKALNQLGYEDPHQLPVREHGLSGVKAEVRNIVRKKDHLFPTKKVFDNTWQQMLDEKLIVQPVVKPGSQVSL